MKIATIVVIRTADVTTIVVAVLADSGEVLESTTLLVTPEGSTAELGELVGATAELGELVRATAELGELVETIAAVGILVDSICELPGL